MLMTEEKKQEKETQYWLTRAIETWDFHRSRKVNDDDWKVKNTAKALRRSVGSVNEDLMIAKWLKTHRNFLEKFETQREALAFIRRKRKEQEWEDIE